MYPFRNPLAERELRIEQGKIERRVNGARNLIFDAAQAAAKSRLTYTELYYLRYLCGMEAEDGDMSPHNKARIGNLFEDAYRKHRKRLDSLPKGSMPGMDAVYANRKVVAELHKEAALRKQGREPNKGKQTDHRAAGIRNNPSESAGWRIIRDQGITW